MKFEHIATSNGEEAIIRVAGLSREFTIMHVTDSHLTESDEREDEGALQNAERRQKTFPYAEVLGKLARAIERCNDSRVDCSVFTGDIVDFPTASNAEAMGQQFVKLDKPFLYTLGNHDWRFSHHPNTDETRAAYTPLLAGAAGEGANPSNQAMDLDGQLRLITIDNSTYQVNKEQVDWFKKQIGQGLPCLVFYHIPLYIPSLMPSVMEKWKAPLVMAGLKTDPQTGEMMTTSNPQEATREFCDLLNGGESGNVVGVFCGHVHFAHEDRFGEGKTQYVTAPCFEGSCRKITVRPL
jgi:3',5'-cyclic AMP phosphodiesterase CpdA